MTTPPDVFLSYSREDAVTARRFAQGLERAGFKVWWDATLSSGEAYDEVTEKALKEAKAVVVLWSTKSVGSRWVRAEATIADRNKTLVPVMIESCDRPVMFELTHTADLSNWSGDPNDKAWQSYVADVRKFVQKGAPEGTAANADSHPPGPASLIPWYQSRFGTIALVAVVLAAALAIWAFNRKSAGTPAAATQTDVTLAVLPFANLSSDPEQEYFSDGLTEELLNQLAQVKGLRVTGRTSSFSFKGKSEDLRVIGKKLDVANLLEGSVRKEGRNLRITAQLISSNDGTHLWSKTYDHELGGVFALQEEIAKDVTKALSIRLDVSDLPRAKGGTTNVEAYDKYLRAADTTRIGGRADLLQAVQNLREAVALDPNFSLAWLTLDSLMGPLASQTPENAPALIQEWRAVVARIETLPLSPQQALDFHAKQSWIRRQWAQAVAATPQLAPDDFLIALILQSVGRVSDSIPHWQRVVQKEPLVAANVGQLQIALDSLGRTAEAKAVFERGATLAADADDKLGGELSYLWARKDSDPVLMKARLKSLLQQPNVRFPRGFNALADKLDDQAAMRAGLRKAFEDPANQNWLYMLPIAQLADHLGDKDLALEALGNAFGPLQAGWPTALWSYYETGLRADPRFKDILRQVGLVDYFRSSGNWGDFCKPVGSSDFECH